MADNAFSEDELFAKELQRQFDEEFEKEEEKDIQNQKGFTHGVSDYVVKFLDDLWNNRNFKIIDDVFDDQCISRGPFGETIGKKEFKNNAVLPLFNAFPDLRYISHEVFQEGRRIVNRWTFTGTHTGGEFAGYKPLGKKVSYSGVTINRFGEDGSLIEINTFFDRLSLFEQISGAETK